MSIARVVISIILGLLTFVVGSLAEGGVAHSRPPLVIAAIMVLYLAISQFLVAPKGSNLWANRATLIGMIGPVVGLFILTVFANIGTVEILRQARIFYLPGCLGIFVGAVAAAAWRTKSGQAEKNRP